MAHAWNVYQLLEHAAEHRSACEAVVDGTQITSYVELLQGVELMAAQLAYHNVHPGARIVLSMSRCTAEVAAIIAVSRLRAAFVSVSTSWTPHQLAQICDDVGAPVLCIDRTRRGQAQLLSTLTKSRILDLQHERDGPFDCLRPLGLPSQESYSISARDVETTVGPPIDKDVAALLYTSGSTGRPKGVVHSNGSLLASARSTVEYLRNKSSDRILCVLPFCFSYGLGQLLSALCVGGAAVLQPPCTAREMVKAIIDQRITGFGSIPPVLSSIIEHLDHKPEAFPDLSYVTVAGGRSNAELHLGLSRHFRNQRKFAMYGSTEALRSTFLAPEFFEERPGCIGKAVPNAEVTVLRADGGVCAPDEIGELVHHGSSVALGYWSDAQETRAKFRRYPGLPSEIGSESAFFSGDMVRRDCDGFIWYVGRIDRLIKASGFRINPIAIEDVLASMEGVTEAIAFGRPDPTLGERICAAVRTSARDNVTEASLRRHCQQALPAHMVPMKFELWLEDFPRTGNNKVDVPALIAGGLNGRWP